MSGAGRAGGGPAAGLRAPGVGAVLLLALAFVATQYPGLAGIPFVGDDYFTLDKTRDAPLSVVWQPRALISSWYRPWSRELHYWALQRLFGLRVAPWHLVSVALWAGVMALYFALVRRLTDARTAAVATAAVMALAGWGALVVWAQGAQDLWMMLFALAALLALERGRAGLAGVAFALALLSKETAALLPLIGFALLVTLGRRPAVAAARAVAPLAALGLAWAALHPLLGGRLWHHPADAAVPGVHPSPASLAARTLLSTVNLHALPAPEHGWAAALPAALSGAAIVVVLAGWGLAAPRAGEAAAGAQRAPGATVAAGLAWALPAWLPLLLPKLGWHAYYPLLGALGLWLALAPLLARHRALALATLAALAVLRAGLSTTPTRDWGTEWFQRRAAAFSEGTRVALTRMRPALPPGSRVLFGDPPGGSGLVPGGEESPPLRVWYRDRTLRAATWERYLPRAAGDSAGIDLFVRFVPGEGWREVAHGASAPPEPAAARRWREDHERLAVALARAQDWRGTFVEYRALAAARPDDPDYAYYGGLALAVLGDSAASAAWIRRAAALPGADEEIRAAARGLPAGPGAIDGRRR